MGAIILRVGLTGGIGSGKSTVADFFKHCGAPIIDADHIAHVLTEKNTPAYQKIISHFGKNILQDDSNIDRKKLRDIIFNNLSEKKWLEDYLHPLIRENMQSEIKTLHAPYCICVIPLLTESSKIDFIDRVLVVDAPLDTQIARAKKRDRTTDADIQKIIDAQASQAARLKMADDVLTNNSNLQTLEKQVKELHKKYLALTAR